MLLFQNLVRYLNLGLRQVVHIRILDLFDIPGLPAPYHSRLLHLLLLEVVHQVIEVLAIIVLVTDRVLLFGLAFRIKFDFLFLDHAGGTQRLAGAVGTGHGFRHQG